MATMLNANSCFGIHRSAIPALSSSTPRPRSSGKILCHAALTEHARYINEVAVVAGSPRIDTLVSVLKAQGQSTVSPADRQGLHPLLVPMSEDPAAAAGNLTCLLRWPEGHKGMELPVVRMSRGGVTVTLLARSAEEYIHRALAEEEAALAGPGPVTESVGSEASSLYEPGAAQRSGLPSLEAYLTRKAGMYCDVAESLALGHLKKGDEMSALITAEWYTRQGNFPEWARPYEFNSWLLKKVGRLEESRDVARIALRMPWWSLQDGFASIRDTAGLSGGADAVRAALDEQEEMANGGVLKGKYRTNPKTDKQIRMDEAAHLLNRAAAGEVSWDDIRKDLAEEYKAAGLADVARFALA